MTIDSTTLQADIERFFSAGADAIGDRGAMDAFLELRSALSAGQVRAAEPDPGTALGWRVNTWVKQGILLGFRLGSMVQMGGGGTSSEGTRATEASVRGFWKAYRAHMGI